MIVELYRSIAASTVRGSEEHDEGFDAGVGVGVPVGAEFACDVEQRHVALRFVPARIHVQCGPVAVVLDDLCEQVVAGPADRGLAVRRRALEGVAQVPAEAGEVVLVTGDHRRFRSGSAFPVVLHFVHERSGREQRRRDLPRFESAAVAFLESSQQQFDVER